MSVRGNLPAVECARVLRSKVAPLSLLALLSSVAITPSMAQTAAPNNSSTIEPVIVGQPKRKPAKRVQAETSHPGQHARAGGRTRAATAKPAPGSAPAAAEAPRTPLNSNVVATNASRLGLTVLQTPASVEIVDQQQMQQEGYRTTT
jgi:iron complex outermembrane receptor protein